jgi:branched-chain amino acid transport system ATP-binding protein
MTGDAPSSTASAAKRATTSDAASDPGPALELRGVTSGYDGIPVVHDVDLTIAPGEVVALLGSNGAGKSTTLLTISGLLPRRSGELLVLGEPVPMRRRMRVRDVCAIAERGVAHVPEDRGLFFDLTVREHLRLGRRRGAPGRPIDELLEWFPALGRVVDRRAGLLSGGEQQMLALARAVATSPRLLLVDELSLGLAPIIVEQLLPVLRTVADSTGTAMLVVEQHVALVLEIADRAAVMRRGRIVGIGTASDLASRPDLIEAGYLGDSGHDPSRTANP